MEILSYNDWIDYKGNFFEEDDNFAKSHSTHLEDLCILRGKKGVGQAIAGLISIKKSFGQTVTNTTSPVTVKIDGCLEENTPIITKNGVKRISEITNEDYVACWNNDIDEVEYYNNTMPHRSDTSKNAIKLIFENGNSIIATDDHLFLNEQSDYEEAKDIIDVREIKN